MKKKSKKDFPKSRYCEHYAVCDKEINCRDENAFGGCPYFKHTTEFSSMKNGDQLVTKNDASK